MGGSNKPHSIARVDGRSIARAFANAMRDESPSTLSPVELGLERATRSVPAVPVPVFAWVKYGVTPVLVAGLMVEWTDAACSLRWLTPEGEEHAAWVWRGAVRMRRPGDDRGPMMTRAERGKKLNDDAARAV